MFSGRKFPVTTASGQEFLVKLQEDSDMFDAYISVKVYVKRKRFGFKCVYATSYYAGREYSVYSTSNPDYIAIVRKALEDYEAFLNSQASARLREEQAAVLRYKARKSFELWDGRITQKEETQ